MKRCNNCPICPFVKEGRYVKLTASNHTVEINRQVNCQTKNILYCITCKKCNVQYIGESERTLQDRFSEHKGYVVNKKLNPISAGVSDQRLVPGGEGVFRTPKLFSANLDLFLDLWNHC